MDRQVVHDWLRSVLVPYANPDRTFADVVSLLESFPSLSPRTDLYISNVGQSLLLLQLKGTVPMQFRGQTYNVPVEIWVDKAYPREPPIGYVSPTRDMLIRKTDHVDLDGSIGGSYQQEWSKKWESKNLLGFIHACQDIFSHQPPVYAKPPASSSSSSYGTPSKIIAAEASRPVSSTPLHQVQQRVSSGQEAAAAANGSSSHHKPPPPLPGQGEATLGPSSSSKAAGPPQKPPKPGQSSSTTPASYAPTELSPRNGAFQSTQSYSPHHHSSNFHAGPSRGALVDSRYDAGYPQPPVNAQNVPAHAGHSEAHGANQSSQQQQTLAASGNHWGNPQSARLLQQASPNHHQHQNGEPRRLSYQQGQAPYRSPPINQHSAAPPAISPTQYPPQPLPQAPYPSASGGKQPPAGNPPPTPPPPKAQAADLLDSLAHEEAIFTSSSSGSGDLTPTPTGHGRSHAHHQQPTPGRDSPAAAPPPRPLNPELAHLHQALHAKLSSRVTELRTSLESSNSHLSLLGRDLDSGPPSIEDESARLKAVLAVCRSRAESLETCLQRVKERTALLTSTEPPKSSEVVLADSIVGDQLINLVAQDLATSDLLYHLGRALGSEEMHLDRYLKWVRLLAREQFLKRALAEKISRALQHGGAM